MSEFSDLTTFEILQLVSAGDALCLPLNRRFSEDDKPLRDYMERNRIPDLAINMQVILNGVMREALNRGLSIPKRN